MRRRMRRRMRKRRRRKRSSSTNRQEAGSVESSRIMTHLLFRCLLPPPPTLAHTHTHTPYIHTLFCLCCIAAPPNPLLPSPRFPWNKVNCNGCCDVLSGFSGGGGGREPNPEIKFHGKFFCGSNGERGSWFVRSARTKPVRT